jgi:hypothetical protein
VEEKEPFSVLDEFIRVVLPVWQVFIFICSFADKKLTELKTGSCFLKNGSLETRFFVG